MLWTDVPVIASEENQLTKQEPHSDKKHRGGSLQLDLLVFPGNL